METKKVAIMALAVSLILSVAGNLYLITQLEVPSQLETRIKIGGVGWVEVFGSWKWKECIEGLVINHSNETVHVEIYVTWYARGVLIYDAILNLGDVEGKSFVEVSRTFYMDQQPDASKFELP